MASVNGLLYVPCIATLDAEHGYGVVNNAAIAWQDGMICYVGEREKLPPALLKHLQQTGVRAQQQQGVLTPALVDCHTHAVFVGHRAGEFEQRLNGVSYAQIAEQGGGIISSVRAVRQASEEVLFAQSLPRLRDLLADGVATLEIKSGYGLDYENERKMLRVARQLGRHLGVTVKTTYLAAHALPPEYAGRSDAYIDAVIEWLPQLHEQGLIDAVDAFCESIGFSPEQTARLFDAASKLGLPVKLHADQLSDLGGAGLVARYHGLSADHVEYTNQQSVYAMANAGTVAVLLPGAFHVLRETQLPPIAEFRAQGVKMAVATDLNPGTAPLRSLRQAMQLACTHFQLTPEEALRGATCHAASALGLNDRGVLREGLRADFALWNIDTPAELCYWLGGRLLQQLWSNGRPLLPLPSP